MEYLEKLSRFVLITIRTKTVLEKTRPNTVKNEIISTRTREVLSLHLSFNTLATILLRF